MVDNNEVHGRNESILVVYVDILRQDEAKSLVKESIGSFDNIN